jgi:glycosyltransferase involved in cell wall biosynthesis
VRRLVVDSDSDDDTARIAATFPVEVYRYRSTTRTAAAGRVVGSRLVDADFVLFVDGDSVIESDWLPAALAYLVSHPAVGIVYGQRREIYEGVGGDYVTHVPQEPGLGGTGLYRAAALQAAGGFHPYLAAEEEGELRARIEARGYSVHQMPELMFTHHTVPKDSLQGYLHRIRRSMFTGYGQVLRSSLRDGSFKYHLDRLNRPVIVAGYLALGALSLMAGMVWGSRMLLADWFILGALTFAALCYRRRDLGSAVYIACDWILSAIGVFVGFFSRLPRRETFRPIVERWRADEGEPLARARWQSVE